MQNSFKDTLRAGQSEKNEVAKGADADRHVDFRELIFQLSRCCVLIVSAMIWYIISQDFELAELQERAVVVCKVRFFLSPLCVA